MKDEDKLNKAFGELEKSLQRKVAHGVTDGMASSHRIVNDLTEALRMVIHERNNVLEEVACEFDRMISFGDTASSFAAFVRRMKG